MPKSILAPLTGFSTDRAILETAAAAARVEGGHIACVYRRIDDLESAATMKLGFPKLHETMSVTIERINKEQSARLAHARTAFDDFVRRHGIAVQNPPDKDVPVSASWEELDSELSGEARYHDMVVMAKDDELSSQQIKSVLVQAGRPLILAPAKPAAVIGRNVAIAWKPGAEAARAVTAASSLLARAEKVSVLAVMGNKDGEAQRAGAERLARSLNWRGIKAEAKAEYASGPEARTLLNMAYGSEADLLVMGAYGHSRLEEYIFGGVTEALLEGAAIPVFMMH